jgi:hypothetical protein
VVNAAPVDPPKAAAPAPVQKRAPPKQAVPRPPSPLPLPQQQTQQQPQPQPPPQQPGGLFGIFRQ